MPFRATAAGCGGFVFPDQQGPTHCGAEPVLAGLWFAQHGRTVWLAFACAEHAGELIAPRPLLPRDRDVLARRRDTWHTELAGRRWDGEVEGPLARGAGAKRLIQRATAWAAAHPS
jgi:hypothetical protein